MFSYSTCLRAQVESLNQGLVVFFGFFGLSGAIELMILEQMLSNPSKSLFVSVFKAV